MPVLLLCFPACHHLSSSEQHVSNETSYIDPMRNLLLISFIFKWNDAVKLFDYSNLHLKLSLSCLSLSACLVFAAFMMKGFQEANQL